MIHLSLSLINISFKSNFSSFTLHLPLSYTIIEILSLSHIHTKCRSHEIFCNSFNSRQSVERGGSKEKSSAKAKLVRKVNKLDGH